MKPLSFLPALVVMYTIFQFSAQDNVTSSQVSGQVSQGIVAILNEKLDLGWPQEKVDALSAEIEGLVRKTAHITEYFVLAVSVGFPLYVYGLRGIPLMIAAGIFCVGFAGADEYHQSFVSGRSPSVRDVGIDSIGILLGLITVRVVGWAGRMTIFRPLSNHKRRDHGGE